MPPAKSRTIQDDVRPDKPNMKDRYSQHALPPPVRARRNGYPNLTQSAPPKDSILPSAATDSRLSGLQPQNGSGGLSWSSEESSLLNAYRTAYNLSAPSACRSLVNAAVLTSPGIGRYSPTMARRKEKRKTPKEQLAKVVRRHFNALAVSETDVVVDFLYKVKTQDKAFRLRFQPPKTR